MRKRTLALAAAAALAGCGGSYTPTTHWLVYHDVVDRFSVHYPQTWHRAPATLTPHLVEPREILTVGTGPLPATGGSCAQVPTGALRALGARGVLVSIQEGPRHATARRPARFHLSDGYPAEAAQCVPGARFKAWRIPFRDAGHGFSALVALGPQAGARERTLALHVLDSFSPY
jgi:hypothetical protein